MRDAATRRAAARRHRAIRPARHNPPGLADWLSSLRYDSIITCAGRRLTPPTCRATRDRPFWQAQLGRVAVCGKGPGFSRRKPNPLLQTATPPLPEVAWFQPSQVVYSKPLSDQRIREAFVMSAALTPRVRVLVVCDGIRASRIEENVFNLRGARYQIYADLFPPAPAITVISGSVLRPTGALPMLRSGGRGSD